MAYDAEVAERIRQAVDGEPDLTEMRMFGGLAFMVGGNMAVAASGQGDLMLRCDPAETEELTAHEHVRRMQMRGREMDGWLRVDLDAVSTADDLARWVEVGVAWARSLPPK